MAIETERGLCIPHATRPKKQGLRQVVSFFCDQDDSWCSSNQKFVGFTIATDYWLPQFPCCPWAAGRHFFRCFVCNGFVSSRYYAAPLAPYYLQLEDDINFAPNWISHITGAKKCYRTELWMNGPTSWSHKSFSYIFSFLTSYIGNTKFRNN